MNNHYCGDGEVGSFPIKFCPCCGRKPYYMENDRKELCFKSKPVDHTDGKCTRFHGLVTYEDFCSDAEEKEEVK